MRQLLIVLLTMGISFSLNGQTDVPVVTPANSPQAAATSDAAPAKLPEPTSTTVADNTRYLNNPDLLTRCTARVSAIEDKECDIIFIGDSITEGWLGAGKDI